MNCGIYTLSNRWVDTYLLHENKYRDLLPAIQDGSSFGDAFRGAYGVSVTEIREQFRKKPSGAWQVNKLTTKEARWPYFH